MGLYTTSFFTFHSPLDYVYIAYKPNTLSNATKENPLSLMIFFPTTKEGFLSKKVIYITIRLNSKAII